MPHIHELIPQLAENVPALLQPVVVRARYDFAVDGGAVGAIDLLPEDVIPDGALVLGAYIRTITPLTSGGAATVALHIQGAADLNAADPIAGAPWSAAGWYACDALTLGSDPIETTAARNVVATIGAAALTAGVFEVYVVYLAAHL